ncbi:pirin family protein [Sinimarinibacterium sp. CAU 1509]|uniref:pirin family protein n=1 Tax=Sinimarinibacterium sp. CAU 1509 TaxID=2562283 RepID=UPI0010ABEDD0|nr:pirin family protein [Sinimarinibacterium sp. CAU 1509]TJY59948.1 pirin family protein [Sinimarinibacterium sp. CAU 1509]
MQTLRTTADRGHAEHGWLISDHSFSFGDYYDPRYEDFGALRVINEDRVVAGAGFAPHAHQGMEILTYVLDGELRHRDSTGGMGTLRPGELQLMSAGSGITHSEMNGSAHTPVHFLQIWITPNERNTEPGYQQLQLDSGALGDGFIPVAAGAPGCAPLHLRQDARVLLAWPAAGRALTQPLDPARRYYLHVARGSITANGQAMGAGDALMLQSEAALGIETRDAAELLLFDLA